MHATAGVLRSDGQKTRPLKESAESTRDGTKGRRGSDALMARSTWCRRRVGRSSDERDRQEPEHRFGGRLRGRHPTCSPLPQDGAACRAQAQPSSPPRQACFPPRLPHTRRPTLAVLLALRTHASRRSVARHCRYLRRFNSRLFHRPRQRRARYPAGMSRARPFM